jgi:hypothetical protein
MWDHRDGPLHTSNPGWRSARHGAVAQASQLRKMNHIQCACGQANSSTTAQNRRLSLHKAGKIAISHGWCSQQSWHPPLAFKYPRVHRFYLHLRRPPFQAKVCSIANGEASATALSRSSKPVGDRPVEFGLVAASGPRRIQDRQSPCKLAQSQSSKVWRG